MHIQERKEGRKEGRKGEQWREKREKRKAPIIFSSAVVPGMQVRITCMEPTILFDSDVTSSHGPSSPGIACRSPKPKQSSIGMLLGCMVVNMCVCAVYAEEEEEDEP